MSKEQWKRMVKKQRRNGGGEKEGKGRRYNKGKKRYIYIHIIYFYL